MSRSLGCLPFLVFVLATLPSTGTAQKARPGTSPAAISPDPDMPRPIEAVESVWIDELAWLEVRDAIRPGKTTVIIPTGGIEANGPYLVTAKHNVILRATAAAIADKLGDALVAPIVPFVPEGEIDPPSKSMRYAGTITDSWSLIRSTPSRRISRRTQISVATAARAQTVDPGCRRIH